METSTALPPELTRGLTLLEQRFALLRAPARRVTEPEWNSLDGAIRDLVPSWITELLLNHAVVGGVLECRDPDTASHIRLFSFFDPVDYATVLADGSLMRRLIEFSLFPFANEADGSAWLVRTDQGPTSTVYLLEHSDWDGGEPHRRNGLLFASSRLELLLASMAVSEASYYDDPRGPRCVMWHPNE